MRTKQITIRIPFDFHQQLVKYAEDHYLPVSRVITQSVAKAISYKHVKPAYRTPYVEPTPEVVYEEEEIREFTEEEYADLLRRADAAPTADV